jgi:hypothetical protein
MGQYAQEGEDLVYKQDDGEITAVLTGFEEITELGHKSDKTMVHVFHICILGGLIYLALILFF